MHSRQSWFAQDDLGHVTGETQLGAPIVTVGIDVAIAVRGISHEDCDGHSAITRSVMSEQHIALCVHRD
eukprot:7112471-Pyramimonas_sp.AAC.1